MTKALQRVEADSYSLSVQVLARLGPYQIAQINRFGCIC